MRPLVPLAMAVLAMSLLVSPVAASGGTPPPPITVPPDSGPTTPPAEAVVDTHQAGAGCVQWFRQTDYAWRWPTGSAWWEYSCANCTAGCAIDESSTFWRDFFYWDGTRSVFFGQWYTESYQQGQGDPCSFWWDEVAAQWYGPYDCVLGSDEPPTASFTVNCSGLACLANGSGSYDPDGTITGYRWSFGDGSVDTTGPSVSHNYPASGSYTISLEVVDDVGLVGAMNRTVTVEGANMAPTAAFTFACSGQDCSFDASLSADSDGMIDAYAWDLGDGTSASGVTASHAFAQAGDHRVTLAVTDDRGAIATSSASFTTLKLTARGYRVTGQLCVDLSWTTASGTFDVFRNGSRITTIAGAGYTDAVPKGHETYRYRVCGVATTICSNEASVSF